MKTDVYTKIVLTVIAIALVANFFKGTDIVTSAQAQTVQQPVNAAPAINQQPQAIDVNIVSIDGSPLYSRRIEMKDGSKKALFPISLEYSDDVVDVTMKRYESGSDNFIKVYNWN